MPGAGKTTVGSILAREMKIPFVDLDEEIQNRVGKSIRVIFSEEGEPKFRDYESAALVEVCKLKKGVIALGAGALEREENFTRVIAKGILVYLRANLPLLVERNRSAISRPLLGTSKTDDELFHRLVELRRRRRYRYQAARVVVDVFGNHSPQETAQRVLRALSCHVV